MPDQPDPVDDYYRCRDGHAPAHRCVKHLSHIYGDDTAHVCENCTMTWTPFRLTYLWSPHADA